jgi:hypothetical protein
VADWPDDVRQAPFDDAAVAEAVRLAKSISALLQAADGHRHPARPSGLA